MVVGAILMTGASLTASILVIQMAVLPLVFKYSKSVQRKMVFSNCINYPRNLNFDNPSSVNVTGGRNCSIKFQSTIDDCSVKIGFWHILPCSNCSMSKQVCDVKDCVALETELLRDLKATQHAVVLYCHGNSNHRASPHRLQMYRVFQELNYHVIAFDYRGYGDSTYVRPTERGVVEDCLHVYSWLINALDPGNRPTVVVWGHSLGSAVVSNMVAHIKQLCQEHDMPILPMPDALVLESPFNNLINEIESHPFSKFVSWLPYYKETFVKPFTLSPDYAFTTDQYLAKVPEIPTLMLHCRGDKIVPYELAVKLYQSVTQSRNSSSAPLVFHSFDKGLGLGHNNICEANDLKNIVKDFLILAKKNQTDPTKTNITQ